MKNLSHRIRESGHFSPTLGHFFPISEKKKAEKKIETN